MSYYISSTNEIKELPDYLVAAWEAAGNPKAAQWTLLPPRPSDDATWNGSDWIAPPIVIPESVSARQIRLWLIRQGISLAAVDAAIANIPDQLQRDSVQVEWEYAPYVERTHPMLIPLAAALGLTEAQVDQAFIEAARI
jgi:hypothetical protein